MKLKSPLLESARKINAYQTFISKSSESPLSKCGTLAYYLLTDHLQFSDHDSVESNDDAIQLINRYNWSEWQNYMVRMIDFLGSDAKSVLGYKTNYITYQKFKAAFDLIKHSAKIYGQDEILDGQVLGTLMNTIFYLPIRRTRWWSVEAIHQNLSATVATDEHYWPRKLSTDIMLRKASDDKLEFTEFIRDVVARYIRVHSVTSAENDILAEYQRRDKWYNPYEDFHPDLPYIMGSVRIVDRETKQFKPIDPRLIEVLDRVKGLHRDDFRNYGNQVLIHTQFDLDLPDDYKPNTTVINEHVIPVITFLEDYFEPDLNSKIRASDLAEMYRSRYFDIHDVSFSKIMMLWDDTFVKTTYLGQVAYAGLRPKPKFEGGIDCFNYTPTSTNQKPKKSELSYQCNPIIDRGDLVNHNTEIEDYIVDLVDAGFISTQRIYDRLTACANEFDIPDTINGLGIFLGNIADDIGIRRARGTEDGKQRRGWTSKEINNG